MGGYDFVMGAGTIWVSDTGYDWSRSPFEPPSGMSVDRLAAIENRLIAVGSDTRGRRGGRGTIVVWESGDGVSWQEVADLDLFADAVAGSLAVADGSVLLCGVLFDQREGADGARSPVSWRWTPQEWPAGPLEVEGADPKLERVGGEL